MVTTLPPTEQQSNSTLSASLASVEMAGTMDASISSVLVEEQIVTTVRRKKRPRRVRRIQTILHGLFYIGGLIGLSCACADWFQEAGIEKWLIVIGPLFILYRLSKWISRLVSLTLEHACISVARFQNAPRTKKRLYMARLYSATLLPVSVLFLLCYIQWGTNNQPSLMVNFLIQFLSLCAFLLTVRPVLTWLKKKGAEYDIAHPEVLFP